MPSLRELQEAFGAALRFGASAAIEPHVLANGIAPAARVRIYRNNTRAQFLSTLRAEFPVLERLVGEEYFRQLAFEYRERHPSPSGNLHHVGERLPDFLSRRFDDTEYAYFPDVARLEWAYQEVLVAAEHAPFEVDRLRQIAPEACPRMVFRLHPAARLVASMFPVLSIWSANQPDGDANRLIDLASGAERVLVRRTAHDVALERLDAAEFAFLASIARGATLSDAETAASGTGTFDPGSSLRRRVADHVIVDFTLPDPND